MPVATLKGNHEPGGGESGHEGRRQQSAHDSNHQSMMGSSTSLGIGLAARAAL